MCGEKALLSFVLRLRYRTASGSDRVLDSNLQPIGKIERRIRSLPLAVL